MKKILVLTTTYPRWNEDTEPAFVHNLCVELSKEFAVYVLTPHTQKAKKEEVFFGVNVIRFSYFYPSSMQKLAYDGGIIPNIRKRPWLALQAPFLCFSMLISTVVLLRRHQFDLIHSHWVIPQGLVALMAKILTRSSVSLLVTSHGADLYSMKSRLFVSLKKWVLEKSEAVTVVSRAMQDYCKDELKLNREVAVQSMGIDTRSRFIDHTAFEQRNGIVFVGRLVEKKGVDLLLAAMAELDSEFNDLQLNIIGDGAAKMDLINQSKELKLGNKVNFLGSMDADSVADYMNKAKICVMPSRVAENGDQEGLGLVAGEAIACGCICVVSNLPPIQDVHNCDYLQFEAGSYMALAETLNRVLKDEQVAKDYSDKLKQRVLKNFDWLYVGQEYQKLISKIS